MPCAPSRPSRASPISSIRRSTRRPSRRYARTCWRARPSCSLLRSRIAHQGGQRGVPAQDTDFVLRHRRGALHLGVGPRLPPGVPPYPADHQRDRSGAADRPDGHGHPQGAARHPEEPGHVRRRGFSSRRSTVRTSTTRSGPSTTWTARSSASSSRTRARAASSTA